MLPYKSVVKSNDKRLLCIDHWKRNKLIQNISILQWLYEANALPNISVSNILYGSSSEVCYIIHVWMQLMSYISLAISYVVLLSEADGKKVNSV